MKLNMPHGSVDINECWPPAQGVAFPRPLERMGVMIPVGDEALDAQLKVFYAVEVAQLQALSVQDREPDLDLVQPGRVRRREVELEAIPMSSVPAPRGLARVGVQVVHHQVDPPARVGVGDAIKVSKKVLLRPGWIAPPKNAPSAHVEAGEQAGRPVAHILELEASLLSDSRAQRARRALKRLDAGLLVDRQDHFAARAAHGVQLYDVPHLLVEQRISAEEPHPEAVRADVGVSKNGANRRLTDLANPSRGERGLRDGADRPVRPLYSEVTRIAARHRDDLVTLQRSQSGRSTRAWALIETGQAMNEEPMPPALNHVPGHAQQARDGGIAVTLRREQNDAPPEYEAVLVRPHLRFPPQATTLGPGNADAILGRRTTHDVPPHIYMVPPLRNCLVIYRGQY
jgi:hypothetical protein